MFPGFIENSTFGDGDKIYTKYLRVYAWFWWCSNCFSCFYIWDFNFRVLSYSLKDEHLQTNNIKSLYISAAHKSSGKTIVSLGLSRILANLNHKVQTFKKGPDYIDMSWLALSSRNQCYNLDFNTQTKKEIVDCYNSNKAKINIIEGNKGLYDGLDLKGSDDNSAMSILTKSNVVLVIDTQGITRGIAPLLQGYINFETKCNIQGIILNKVNNERHENKLVNAVKIIQILKF